MSVRQIDKLELTVLGHGRTLDKMLEDAEKNAEIADAGWLLFDLTSRGVTRPSVRPTVPGYFQGVFTATYRRKTQDVA